MAQGLDTGSGSCLNALLTGPVSHEHFLNRETADGKVPSPQAPPGDDSQSSREDLPDETPEKKPDPDWEGNESETEVSESESESESDSDDSGSESEDEDDSESEANLVNGHSEQSGESQEGKFAPDNLSPTEGSSVATSSEAVCSQVVTDLLKQVVPSPEEVKPTEDFKVEFCSESSDSHSQKHSNLAVRDDQSQDSLDKTLDSVPDFLDLIDSFDPESSQDVKSGQIEGSLTCDPADIADENQGKKKKKRKRKRNDDEPGQSRKRKRKENGEGKKRKKEPGEKRKKKAKKEDGDKLTKSVERKNIRKILTDENLDEETRTAQQLEMERKKRLQEFQRNAQNNVHLKALLQSSDEEEDKDEDEKIAKSWRQTASKSKDVVTISSSDEDDVVMLDEKKKSAAESDSEDDPNDAGCHVNDILNIPDDTNRVLVNVGHPEEDEDIYVNDRLATALKPHQIGGIRFLYDNLVESLNHFKASNGFGCILAHSMGLGKTIQVVTFVDIFLRHTDAKYVLCIVPINTLQNWVNEFNMWLPVDPSKVPQPPAPKQKPEKKEEKPKQDKSEFDPFGMNYMNYPWVNSSFNQPPMNSQMGNWNSYGYGNGQWDPMAGQSQIPGQSQMDSASMMGQMGPNSQMGPSQNPMGPSQNPMSQSQNPFQTYGQPYPQVKQEFGNFSQEFQQPGYGGYGQCASGYGQYPGQEPYNMNYGMNNSNHFMPPYQKEQTYGINGPTSEMPKFPPLTPPPESNATSGPTNSSSNCPTASTNQTTNLLGPPLMGTNHQLMGNGSSGQNQTSTDTNKCTSSVPYSNGTVKSEPVNHVAPSVSSTVKSEPGIKVEPKTEVKVEPQEQSNVNENVKKERKERKEGERETAIDPELADTPWRPFEVYVLSDNHKNMTARSKVVGEWKKTGGVLLMGYEMYRLLATRKPKKRAPRKADSKKVIDVDQEDKDNELAIELQAALLKPGPDLVICDEGHRIKNSHAGISQALKNIKTRRRVVLTGYPLQNNLVEYWCMVDFVRPNFLGSKTEFSNMFERPIMNGQCHDSTSADCKLMRYRAHVLHSLLEGFVQRRGHTVLREALPPKSEYVILVKMSDIQRKLYTTFMQRVNDAEVAEWATTNPIKAFSVMCKIWNHPDILYKIVKRLKDGNVDDDLELADDSAKAEEDRTKKRARKPRGRKAKAETEAEGAGEEKEPEVKGNIGNTITYDWAQEVMSSYVPGHLSNGGKMLCMFSIMEESIAIGDKILIFSQSLFTLNLIEEFLSQAYVPVPGCEEKWTKNRHYYRLDGSTSATDREKMVNNFNNPDNECAWLFLLSTRAGCLGINLTGANRVIVYDASWNPCHDCQAVCRVYRYGQTKPCFIYRLVSDNTMEKKIYDRQVSKQTISDRVVDELNSQHKLSRKQMEDLLHYEDVDQPLLDVTEELLDKYDDPVIQSLMRNNGDFMTKEPFTHESLLIDRKDYRLSKAEKNMARLSYEREKKMSAYGGYTRPSYTNYYPKVGGNSLITGVPGNNLVINRTLSTPLPRVGGTKAVDGKAGANTGVTVHQIVTTTDIVVPGSSKDPKSQYKIPAGQQVLVIKTPRGVYIRTPEGKIFAVRTTGKLGNETALPGLGTPVTAAGTSGTGAGTPLVSSAAQKSLLTKVGGALSTTTPRILGSVRRRAVATPSIRLTNPRPTPGTARPTTSSQQSVITLDDSDDEPDEETTKSETTDSEKVVTAPPVVERKRGGQISLIKPIGGLNDPPPQSVKVIMKPPVSRQNSNNSEGSKSPRGGELTSILRKSPMGSPASARSPATISSDSNDDDGRDRTITLVRPPVKKPPARTQIFLSRSSDETEEKKNANKLTLVTKPSVVTTTQSVSTSAAPAGAAVMTSSAPVEGATTRTEQTSNLTGLLSDQKTSRTASSTSSVSASKPFQSMTDLLAAPTQTKASDESYPSSQNPGNPGQRHTATNVPAFSQPYKNASQVSSQSQASANMGDASAPTSQVAAQTGSNMAAPTGNNMGPMNPRIPASGGTMTERNPKVKPMNWMLPDEKPTPPAAASGASSSSSQQMALPSFSNLSRNETKNPLEGMMSMSGFGNTWSNPYTAPVPASQPLPPWPGMEAPTPFPEKKRRDPFSNYPQQDYRYNYPQMDFFNSPYYQQPNPSYPSYPRVPENYPRTFGNSSYYSQNQMFPGQQAASGDFQPRYGQALGGGGVPGALEPPMPGGFDAGAGDANSLKWQTAFSHAASANSGHSASYPSQRSSVPDLPDLSSLGEF